MSNAILAIRLCINITVNITNNKYFVPVKQCCIVLITNLISALSYYINLSDLIFFVVNSSYFLWNKLY